VTEPVAKNLECVEVVITAESAEWLADVTRQLVEDRLVACGHNVVPIRAIYRWEGKIHDETRAGRGASHPRLTRSRDRRSHRENTTTIRLRHVSSYCRRQ